MLLTFQVGSVAPDLFIDKLVRLGRIQCLSYAHRVLVKVSWPTLGHVRAAVHL